MSAEDYIENIPDEEMKLLVYQHMNKIRQEEGELTELQSKLLAGILKKDTKLVLEVIKEINMSKDDVRRILYG